MFIFHPFVEDADLITYRDMQHAYNEMKRHNTLIQDALRKEVKSLKACYVRSLVANENISDQKGVERLVKLEQLNKSGGYEKCAVSCLLMKQNGGIEFRISTAIDETPIGNMFIPAYITLEYSDNLIKISMSLSNSRSDKRAELYVSRGEEPERYTEAAEYIKSMMMSFIAEQKLPG